MCNGYDLRWRWFLLHPSSSSSSHCQGEQAGGGEPAAHFSSDMTQKWVRENADADTSRCVNSQRDGRVKFSYFRDREAVWLSVIWLNVRSGFPRCWRRESDRECSNPVDEVCVRLSSVFCVCVLTGRVIGHRALLTGELLRHWVRCH